MRILLIDNTKADSAHFTRLLEKRLSNLIGKTNVITCSTIQEVVTSINDDANSIDAAILSGSTLNLSQPNRIEHMRKSLSALLRLPNVPVLGICFGMQLIAMTYGGLVRRLNSGYAREAAIHVSADSVLFHGTPRQTFVTLSHQDYVEQAPVDFNVFSVYEGCVQVIESLRLLRFGVQFHPEKVADGATACTLLNFCRFVQEKIALPASLSDIDDSTRMRIVFIFRRCLDSDVRSQVVPFLDRNTVSRILCHHAQIWDRGHRSFNF